MNVCTALATLFAAGSLYGCGGDSSTTAPPGGDSSPPSGAPPGPTVKIDSLGTVEGYADGTLAMFRGIPFAKPPVGELRWKAPEAYPAFESTFQAKQAGASCVQSYESYVFGEEDCLFLNVVTPSKALTASEKLPVMVFVHGGGYTQGDATSWKEETLVRKSGESIILVTVAYRLGVFGFLGSNELRGLDASVSTGNYGIQDQRLALKWVQDHIHAFGGDKLKVTLAGQSAGGNAVYTHMVQPESFPLYARVISYSGSYTGSRSFAEAEAVYAGIKLATACTDTACLRGKTKEELMTAVAAASSGVYEGLRLPFGPVIDGVAMTNNPQMLFASGSYKRDAPVLMGADRDEFAPEMSAFFPPEVPFDEATMSTNLQFFTGSDAAKVDVWKALYDPSVYSYPFDPINFSTSWWMAMRILTEQTLTGPSGGKEFSLGHCAHRCIARNLVRHSPEVYQYLFVHPTQQEIDWQNGYPLPGMFEGSPFVPHSAELPYVFGKLDLFKNADEKALAETISSFIVNFVVKGDPNGDGLPTWPFKRSQPTDKVLAWNVGASMDLLTNWSSDQCDDHDASFPGVC